MYRQESNWRKMFYAQGRRKFEKDVLCTGRKAVERDAHCIGERQLEKHACVQGGWQLVIMLSVPLLLSGSSGLIQRFKLHTCILAMFSSPMVGSTKERGNSIWKELTHI